jgi:hypothetical protein
LVQVFIILNILVHIYNKIYIILNIIIYFSSWYYNLFNFFGISGIFYILLDCENILNEKNLLNLIIKSIDKLIEFQFEDGNFPSSYNNNNNKLIQWCHGAPGVIPLLIKIYKITNDKKV